MKPILYISIVILSLSIYSWGGNAQPPPAYRWGGFRLTIQWPAAFCELNAQTCVKSSLLNTFTIHGLWPHDTSGTSLRNCQGSVFAVNSVSDFLAEMHLAWPSFNNRRVEDFWKHEWDAHGKCSEALLTQTNYFRTSLAFRKAFDILGLLNREGIYPNNAHYPPGLIKEAIRKNLNSMPELVCKTNQASEFVLTEIYLCVNQLATKFVDCPATSPTANCNTRPLKFVSLA